MTEEEQTTPSKKKKNSRYIAVVNVSDTGKPDSQEILQTKTRQEMGDLLSQDGVSVIGLFKGISLNYKKVERVVF